jgi:fatty acid desaturase
MTDIRSLLTAQEMQSLQQKSNWQGLRMLLVNWALIVGSFVLVILWPGALSVACALVVLGGRHLGLGILMHECAHRSLTQSRGLNEWIGQWLCAAPAFADLGVYRAYHMVHHVKTGTPDDPDLPNYAGYPVSRASLARKFLRDLTCLTGLKAAATLAFLYAHREPGKLRFGYAYKKKGAADAVASESLRLIYFLWNTRRILLVHGLALAGLWSMGHPLAYLLWPLSWLSTYMLFARIRNAAEHGGLPGTMTTDIWHNTRTVYARWWERLTVAPNYVNFHVEHHLLPTVPSYQLRRMHQLLKDKEALQQQQLLYGYGAVLSALVGTAPEVYP